MKKIILIFIVFIVALTGGVMFVACGTTPTSDEPPASPTLQKSSFTIWYSYNGDGEVDYTLTWEAENATEYRVVCDEIETTVTNPEFSLNDYSADTVHTVSVTAIGQKDTESAPVEIKFKGVKLATPTKLRFSVDDNSFVWDRVNDGISTYIISCEELDLDIATSKPIYTGRVKYALAPSELLSLHDLREIYNNYDLYALESLRVRALPYNGGGRGFHYTDDTDILEFPLPSDFSEQSVNLYAGKMSNPTNLRWDFDDFNEHRDYAYVKWDGAVSDYYYQVKVQYPDQSKAGIPTENGASQGKVYFDYRTVTGDYTVTVEPECYKFNYIGEDKAAKSVTYSFYLPQPIAEKLQFHADQTVLDAPKNLRIDGENIVWDAVEHANSYTVKLECGKDALTFRDVEQLSLKTVFDAVATPFADHAGDWDISVVACGKEPVLVGIEDNAPVINTYKDSERSDVWQRALRLKPISLVQNVNVDYQNSTISWDGVSEAIKYHVTFFNAYGGYSMEVGKDTQYTWTVDISKYSEIGIVAKCEYKVIQGDGFVTVMVPSIYRIKIEA